MNSAKQVKSASVVTTTFLVKSVTTETRNTRPRWIGARLIVNTPQANNYQKKNADLCK